MAHKGLAVVTGASTGIGLELAKLCAADGYEVLMVANEDEIRHAAGEVRSAMGVDAEALQCDLGTEGGVDQLWMALKGRKVDLLLANAGLGLGQAFLDQDFERAKKVIDLNVTGTTSLLHKVGRQMRDRNGGRILVTGSIAGMMPGSYQAVYNATKAYLDSFSYALRNELQDTDVSVTCLMPGPVDTEFFERAKMEGTPVGEDESKSDPADVARDGYKAMMAGEPGVVSGLMNKVQAAFAGVIPDTVLAEMHRHLADPKEARN